MSSLLAPLALALLASLPILWWMHRRELKPDAVTLPSLMFLADEKHESDSPVRRRVDGDLLLALAAAASFAIAAAGPVFGATGDGRRVALVRDVSPSMAARSAAGSTASERASAGVNQILTSHGAPRFGPNDRVERSSDAGGALIRKMRDASSGVRILVSDRRPADLPYGVVFVGVGDPDAVNAGIVAVDIAVEDGRRRAFATIWNDAAMPRSLRAGPIGAETQVNCPAFGAARATWDLGPIPNGGGSPPTTIHVIDDGGALAVDDAVVLDPSPINVSFAHGPDGPAPLVVDATREALDAIFGGRSGWREDANGVGGLFVGPRQEAPSGASFVLEIGRVAAGVEPTRSSDEGIADPLDGDLDVVRDLDGSACEWIYPPDPAGRTRRKRISVDRVESARRTVVRWHADPSLGRPAAIETPLWPLFIENVVALAGGVVGPAGHRLRGTLDRDVTRIGRDVVPLDEAALNQALAATPRDVTHRRTPLRPWLGVLGSICLGLLWCRPRKGRPSPVR